MGHVQRWEYFVFEDVFWENTHQPKMGGGSSFSHNENTIVDLYSMNKGTQPPSGDKLAEFLKRVGDEGWEMCGYSQYQWGDDLVYGYIFKRPLQEHDLHQ